MTTDTSSKDLNICVLGIDPGLVHTGVVELYLNFSAILLSIRSQVFLPTEIPSIPNWRTQPPTGVVFIEAYQPRSHFATDTRMLELIQQLRQLLPDARVIKNTAVKKLVPAPLLDMLQLYDFSQASHHQDLRSAARIALLGMMKDPDLNMRLSKMFYEAITFDPNWTIRKTPVTGERKRRMNTDELLKQREADWDDAIGTHCRISQAWSGLFNREVQPHQVALAMAQLELIRASSNPYNPDSLQNAKAYIQIAQQILEQAEEELTRSQHAPQYEQLPLFESLPSPQVV